MTHSDSTDLYHAARREVLNLAGQPSSGEHQNRLYDLAAQLRAQSDQHAALGGSQPLLRLVQRWREPSADLPEADLSLAASAQSERERCADELEDLLAAAAFPGQGTSAQLLLSERQRQIDDGWTPEGDDLMTAGELARAAAAYALLASGAPEEQARRLWPDDWSPHGMRPRSTDQNLLKAAGLLVAELDRRLRQTRRETEQLITDLASGS